MSANVHMHITVDLSASLNTSKTHDSIRFVSIKIQRFSIKRMRYLTRTHTYVLVRQS